MFSSPLAAITAILLAGALASSCGSVDPQGGRGPGIGNSSGSGGSGGAGGRGPEILDGTSCTFSTKSNCDPACLLSCGSSPNCIDLCCTESTVTGSRCSGSCVDPTRDPNNCGACGAVCGTDQVCQQGTCKTKCVGTSDAVTRACASLCAKMGSTCVPKGLILFPYPGTSAGGNPGGAWTETLCNQLCQSYAVTGPCADASAALASCWASSLTCSGGTAVFPACDGEVSVARACVAQCATQPY
jgi:hypothetical protein